MRFAEAESLKAPAFAVVRPDAFNPRWNERPTAEVAIGLRPIGNEIPKLARAQAAKTANDAHPDVDTNDPVNWPIWVESFNDALMLGIVAQGICDPNDATLPWKPFEAAPEDMARDFLTPGGVRYLYDRWEKMRIDTDPIAPEITDDELVALPDLLDEKLPLCGPMRRARVKRLLAFVVEELHGAETKGPPAKV
jgi:hypothetical protein